MTDTVLFTRKRSIAAAQKRMTFTVTFQTPEALPHPGADWVQFGFPFSVVDSSLEGKPEEKAQTREHRLIVRICRNRLPAWHFSDENLMKVLFEYGRRTIEEHVAADTLPTGDTYTFHREMLTTSNTPHECPYDPDRIRNPDGYSMQVERVRRMGF